MQHSVAVRAYGTEIFRRIYLVLISDFRYRYNVMNVNEPLADLSVTFLECKATYLATCPVATNTFLPGF